MRPIYKSLALAAMTLQVSLDLYAKSVTEDREIEIQAEMLDSLRVELIAPNTSGARDLIKSGECELNGSNLQIILGTANWIKGAMYRVQVVATFGTQTQVIYALDVTVPYYVAMSNETQEHNDAVYVVLSAGGVDNADGEVYAKDGDGNAHVTKPLSIGSGIATGAGAVANGRTDVDGSYIKARGIGAVASGYTDGADSYINAGGTGAVASGCANGDGSYIEASGIGAVASGRTDGDGSYIEASGAGAVASGRADGDGSHIEASGAGAVASGRTDETSGDVKATGSGSQAFGIGVQATQEAQMVFGKCNVVDTGNDYQFIVGNGADDQNRSNAFAVTKSGELALFESDGTPVILTAANLKSLIASLQ